VHTKKGIASTHTHTTDTTDTHTQLTQLTQLTAKGKHLSSTFDTAQIRGRVHGRPILIRVIEDGATIRMLVHNEVHV